jgi:ubiquinone/menaquinone biosynthesis C-methylase UbiE
MRESWSSLSRPLTCRQPPIGSRRELFWLNPIAVVTGLPLFEVRGGKQPGRAEPTLLDLWHPVSLIMKGCSMDLKGTYSDRGIHEKWESVYRENTGQRHFNDQIMKRIMKLLNPSAEDLFLDAGCGVGDHTVRIARYGVQCVGIDISETILDDGRKRIAQEGMSGRVRFQTESLEGLTFQDESFDFVHCRGVLMHIPDWEQALKELGRVLKPGGKLVLIESNLSSIEAQLVKWVRRASRRKSKLVETPGGWEFWSKQGGNPFVVRIANICYMNKLFNSLNMRIFSRFATEFWDINRFPQGLVRDGMIAFNRIWFSLHLPASLSVGNAMIAEKLPSRLG